MRHKPIRRAFRLDLRGGLTERQCLSLREHIGKQHVVMPAQWIEGLREGDKIAGNKPRTLMDQLIKGVLSIGAGLTPVDGAGLAVDWRAGERHVLAVALHSELLEIGRKALQILLIRKHGDGLRAEE